ncbi:MAG: MBL fold metallo-hydrolase [Spirochaetaceae bacterium]|jgi:glyoxylase-like metal-dependent hydrolase (beta-lactamase superfamily II)|nr:MBL fold metallo-hydrolase [Spirochaetaceae bacterium]
MNTAQIERIVVGALATNCYIVPLGAGAAAVVDPGDDADAIVERLEALALRPRCVLLTHGHFDHLAALPPLVSHYAMRGVLLGVAIHGDDAGFLGKGAYEKHCASFRAVAGDASYVDGLWRELPEPSRVLKDGDLVERFTVVHLPGHSAGSVGFYDAAGGVLISGDVLFNCGVGRSDLPESDPAKLEASLLRLFALPPLTRVFPGHGEATSIGREAVYYS